MVMQCRLVKMLIPAGEDTRRGQSVAGVPTRH